VDLTFCTFADNTADGTSGKGGGLYVGTSAERMNIDNCIFYFNTASDDEQISDSGTNTSVNYSCIEGGFVGTGNVSGDPDFSDQTNDDYTIDTNQSTVVDAGTNGDTNGAKLDLAGDPRRTDGDCDQTATVDMGAYEYPECP
jgi:hypothetical protein